MNALSTYLEKYSYDYILSEALKQVPDTVDKREGAIIRDALAPCCYEAAKAILYLADIIEQTYVATANGLWLDGRVLEGGITRDPATYSKNLGVFKDQLGNPVQISIGQTFSTVGDTILNYVCVQVYVDENGDVVPGSYVLQCNTIGSVGNSYIGRIVPNDYIEKLASAEITSLLYPGEEEETDESLRERYLGNMLKTAFGGNVAQYRQWAKEIAGIGGVQVYPVWAGGEPLISIPSMSFVTSLTTVPGTGFRLESTSSSTLYFLASSTLRLFSTCAPRDASSSISSKVISSSLRVLRTLRGSAV